MNPDKTGVYLMSPEKDKARSTTVLLQVGSVPKGHTSKELIAGLEKDTRSIFPKNRFEYIPVSIDGIQAVGMGTASVPYRGRAHARFSNVNLASKTGQWLLTVSMFEPDKNHQAEVGAILRSIRLKNVQP